MSKQGYFDPNTQTATPEAVLGQVHIDEYGRRWIYGRDSGSGTTAGYVNYMTTAGSYTFASATVATVGTAGSDWKFLGVPNINVTASYYTWYWIGYGTFEVVVINGVTAADKLYIGDTAGQVGATDTGHQPMDGVKLIDTGVTNTRVTIWAANRLTAGMIACAD